MWETLKTIEAQFYNVVIAVVVLLVGLIIGLVVRKVLRKLLHEFELDKTVERLGKDYSLEKRLSNLAAYVVYFITLVIFLNLLGITSIVLYVVVGAVLLLIGVTFLLGIKDFIPNLIGGLIIYRKGYKVGGKIKVNGVEGTIENLGWLEMEIKSKKGDKIYIPNSLLAKSKVWLEKKSK